MSPSRIFLFSCVAFVAGIFGASLFFWSQQLVLILLIGGVFLFTVFWQHKRWAVLGLFLICFALGAWRQEATELKLLSDPLRKYAMAEANVYFQGIVVEEPEQKLRALQVVVKPKEGTFANSQGKVLLRADSFSRYQVGDVLDISGTLQLPFAFDDFDYEAFLGMKGIYALMNKPEIALVATGHYDSLVLRTKVSLLAVKNTFREVIARHLSPPKDALLGALLYGDESRMSGDLKAQLARTGIIHITAVSGQHVAILVPIVSSLLLGIGLWRQQAVYGTLAFMMFFILFIGMQPSAVRAGIMGTMMLASQQIGRMQASFRALVFAATLMLAFNPLLLRHDIGFQLSFLAVLGMIVWNPLLGRLLSKVPNPWGLREVFTSTITAQIFTLPLLIYTFGQFSLVSMPTNLLVVPMLPLLMILGFLFLLFGAVWGSLASIAVLPVSVLLHYLIFVVNLFDQFPFAAVSFQDISPFLLALIYLPLLLILWRLRRSQVPLFL